MYMYIAIQIDEDEACSQAHILAFGPHAHCKAEAQRYVEVATGKHLEQQKWAWTHLAEYEYLVREENGDPNIHIRSATIPFGRIGDKVELLWLEK